VDTFLMAKAGFCGFALSLGMLMLVFYVVGRFTPVSPKRFIRVFVLAAIASFLVTDAFLYYKIITSQVPQSQMFLAGCIGGWLGGIISGLTNMKGYLLRLGR
jgi:hypothetical protein